MCALCPQNKPCLSLDFPLCSEGSWDMRLSLTGDVSPNPAETAVWPRVPAPPEGVTDRPFHRKRADTRPASLCPRLTTLLGLCPTG